MALRWCGFGMGKSKVGLSGLIGVFDVHQKWRFNQQKSCYDWDKMAIIAKQILDN
jgi:hypothetical protein